MSIIDKIKSLIESFRNRNNPRLEEGNFDVEHTPHNSTRDEFVRNLSYREPNSAPLVDRRRELVKSTSEMLDEQRRPQARRYTTNRTNRLEAQRKAQQKKVRLGIVALVSSLAIASSCLALCNRGSYEDMSLQELENVLSSDSLTDEELTKISNALENDGLDILKGKIADATGLEPEHKDSLIKVYGADDNAPTTIITPSGTFRSPNGVGVYDSDRNSIISDGISAVIDSTAIVQDENHPLDRNLLKRYAKLLKECDESHVYVTPNTYAGNIISADTAHESILTELSIAEKNEISLENNIDSNDELDL